MDGERPENTLKKKRNVLLNIIIAIIVLAIIIISYLSIKGSQDYQTSSLLFLSVLNTFLLLALMFLLFRQLLRGYLGWRRSKEGARIRTRLLSAFVLLGVIPSSLLLIAAVFIFESAIESWFRLPVHTINQAGQKLVDESLNILRELSLKRANSIANQLSEVPIDLQISFLRHSIKEPDFDVICLIDKYSGIVYEYPSRCLTIDKFRTEKIFSKEGVKGYIILGEKSYVISSASLSQERAIITGYLLPEKMLDEARFISDNQKLYLKARSQRKVFKITVISSFLALTLAVIYASIWIGTRLTKEISEPMQLLLEGTEEVSKGNLQHRIEYNAKDEIGQVVSSFNQMVKDLLRSKEAIEKSTEELRKEKESSEEKRNYIEVLVESLNVGIVSIGKEGEILSLNKKAREFFNITQKDPPQKCATLPFWKILREHLGDFQKPRGEKAEVVLTHRDEARVIIAEAIPLIKEGSDSQGSILILEDVTDLSRTQRIAAWQEVAQRLAHEIKNPLTPIRLSAQRIRKKLRENSPDLQEIILEGTTTIEREVESMMNMVNEFSRFARLPETKLKAGNIEELIRASALPYQNGYPKVSFFFEFPENIPDTFFDYEQLERVFKNLFENSIEAMKMAGKISVKVEFDEKNLIVKIRDTGPGIPKEIRSKMFLPYFSTKRKGTGLGLAIVARIVDEHGGKIEVDEDYREGAGINITFPR